LKKVKPQDFDGVAELGTVVWKPILKEMKGIPFGYAYF
jgi:hypothetical protein